MFGRDEIAYLRAELTAQHARYDRMVERYSLTIETMRRDGYVAPEPIDRTPFPDEINDIAPSIDVVIDELSELSPRPEEVRRQLTKFVALKKTQGKTDAEVVSLIRKGGEVLEDEESEEFI